MNFCSILLWRIFQQNMTNFLQSKYLVNNQFITRLIKVKGYFAHNQLANEFLLNIVIANILAKYD